MKALFSNILQNRSLKSVIILVILQLSLCVSARTLEYGSWHYISDATPTFADDTKYNIGGKEGYHVSSLTWGDYLIEFSSPNCPESDYAIFISDESPYISLFPYSGRTKSQDVTIKISRTDGCKIKSIGFYDTHYSGYELQPKSTSTGTLQDHSSKGFSWKSSAPDGADYIEALITCPANGIQNFCMYNMSTVYLIDSHTLPVVDLADYFSGLYLKEDQPEIPSSVDYFEMVFNKNLQYNDECTEPCTLSLGGKIIKTFDPEDIDIFNIACGCYIDENGNLVSYEMCNVSIPLESPLTASGTYTFTIPDNFLTRSYEPTKGVSGSFTIFNEESGVTDVISDSTITVFSTTGVCLMKDAPASDLSSLPAGLYIVNGKKVIKK